MEHHSALSTPKTLVALVQLLPHPFHTPPMGFSQAAADLGVVRAEGARQVGEADDAQNGDQFDPSDAPDVINVIGCEACAHRS